MNWKAISGYEGFYEVSDTGIIRSVSRTISNGNSGRGSIRTLKGKVIKPYLAGKYRDYEYVKLNRIGDVKSVQVHKLVATAFLPNPLNLPEVNHKDGIKSRNSADNLEWTTHTWNVRHAIATGLTSSMIGEMNIGARLTHQTVEAARRLFKIGCSQKDIARRFGTTPANIHCIVRNKSWRHLKVEM